METSNLCIIGITYLLFLIWLLSIWGFGSCRDLHDKPRFTENDFRKKRSNLCILGISSLLVLIWILSLWSFGSCHVLHDKPSFIENEFRKKNLLRFRCWRFYRLLFIERSNLSPFGFIFHFWTMMFLCILF